MSELEYFECENCKSINFKQVMHTEIPGKLVKTTDQELEFEQDKHTEFETICQIICMNCGEKF